MVKITSAQRAANALPRPEDPAWMTTGRAWGVVGMLSGPRERNQLAFMVDIVDPVGIGVNAARLIEYEGVIVPASPELVGQLNELVGAVIPLIVVEVRFNPKVQRFSVMHGRDHIPSGPSTREVIERSKLTRHVIGLIVRRRPCGSEPQVARHRRHRSQDRHRIEARRILIAESDADLEVQAVAVRDPESVGEEDEVELPALKRPGEAQVEVEVEKFDLVRRVPPDGVAVADRPGDEEAAQVHLSHAAGPSTSTRSLLGDVRLDQPEGSKVISVPRRLGAALAITEMLCTPEAFSQLRVRPHSHEHSGVALGCPVRCSGNVWPSQLTTLSHRLFSLVHLVHHHMTDVSPAAAA